MDERFCWWWLHYAVVELRAEGTGSTYDAVTAEDIETLRVPMRRLEEQRTIADFLDTENSRIDALLAKKRRVLGLLEERRWISFLGRVDSVGAELVPLRRGLVFLTDGPFGSAFSSDEYSDDGVGVIRLGNSGFAEFRSRDLAYLPSERFSEFQRHEVREGDLLIAGLGDARNHAGRACVAPDLGRAIVKGKCFCGRVETSRAVAEYLALFLSSPRGAEFVNVEVRGSTRSMINLEIVKSVLIPLPTLDAQHEIVARTRQDWAVLDTLQQRLQSQLALLQEHRQALITAAVTGELEIPGVGA